jgi:hypothetical protein
MVHTSFKYVSMILSECHLSRRRKIVVRIPITVGQVSDERRQKVSPESLLQTECRSSELATPTGVGRMYRIPPQVKGATCSPHYIDPLVFPRVRRPSPGEQPGWRSADSRPIGRDSQRRVESARDGIRNSISQVRKRAPCTPRRLWQRWLRSSA